MLEIKEQMQKKLIKIQFTMDYCKKTEKMLTKLKKYNLKIMLLAAIIILSRGHFFSSHVVRPRYVIDMRYEHCNSQAKISGSLPGYKSLITI